MYKFIFFIVIPALAGLITGINGVGWFDGDLMTAALFNIPVCLVSCLIGQIGSVGDQ